MTEQTIELIVEEEQQGQRIDKTVATLLPEYSRSRLNRWLKEGRILINGKTCQSKDKVKCGDILQVKPALDETEIDDKPQDIPLNIIFEDDDIIVINKPCGLVVHPGAGNQSNTLLNALLHHHPSLNTLPRAGIIHRIDKDTTGLLIIAKSLNAHHKLTQMMQEKLIKRRYLALVNGLIIAGNTIHTYMARSIKNRLKMAVSISGKEAITHYRVKTKFNNHSLLDVELETGRTHQIRVHMAHIGHPIVGDQLYGKRNYLPKNAQESLINQLQQFKHQALHAYELSLAHPISNEPLSFKAPIPEDFNSLLSSLEEHKNKNR